MNISKHWKTIFETLQDSILVVDLNGNIVAVNPAAEKLTGYSAQELVGSSCRILNCTGCKIKGREKRNHFCNLFSMGKVRSKKCLITNKEQRLVNVLKSATVLRDKQGQMIGAVETLTDISELERQRQEIFSLRRAFSLDVGYHGILGNSESIRRLTDLIENVARTSAPVMIMGQSGTGKELIARAIHESSLRKDEPFIKVNCAALNENLLESELFGHVKGAFTGADRTRIGRFEAAHGGSILLDEVGDIPPSIQVKLLRVLEEREIERVGDHQPIKVDVRVISATNRNLEKLIAQGLFREDLYFRINVFPIYCPSLSERLDDIPILVNHFIQKNREITGKPIYGIASEAMEQLMAYHWPGNIRELRNAIEYAFILCQDSQIRPEHLPPRVLKSGQTQSDFHLDDTAIPDEKADLIQALTKAGGNRSKAAELLGVSRVTVWKRMKKYGIQL